MAMRRNHFTDGYGGPQPGGYGGFGGSQADAFPSYSGNLSSGNSKGKKFKNFTGLPLFLSVALGTVMLVAFYLLVRMDSMSRNIKKLEKDLHFAKKDKTKLDFDLARKTKDLDRVRSGAEDKELKLEQALNDLKEERVRVQTFAREGQEHQQNADRLEERVKELENEIKQLKATPDMGGKIQELEATVQAEQLHVKSLEAKLDHAETTYAQERRILELDLQMARASLERIEAQRKVDDAAAAKAAAANPAAPNVPADGIAEAKLEALSLTSTPDAPPPVGYQTGAAEHEGPANWQDAPQDDNGAADFATGGAEAVPIVGEVEDAVRKGEDGEAARGSAFHEASSS